MVQAPKCKVCGEAHFGAAHVWKGSAPPTSRPPTPSPAAKPAPDAHAKLIGELRARIAELEGDAAKTAARREKQRVLMQARRATK